MTAGGSDIDQYVNAEAERCEASCDRGNPKSCAILRPAILGHHVQNDHETPDREVLEHRFFGLNYLMQSCEGGIGIACADAAHYGQEFWKPKHDADMVECLIYERGDCGERKAVYVGLEADDMLIETPLLYAKMGCELSDNNSCRIGLQLLKEFAQIEAHKEYEIEFFEARICKYGTKLQKRALGCENS